MPLDALLLSRPEVGAPFALQIVFASFALGLASYLLVLQGLWLATGTLAFQHLRGLWTKVFLAAAALALAATLAGFLAGGLSPPWRAAAEGFPYRPAQLAISAFLGTALVVGATSAWRLLKDPEEVESCLALRMAIGMFVICAPLEIVIGDGHTARPGPILALAAAAALLGAWGAVLCWRTMPERSRLFLAACVLMGPIGLLAPIAEWLGLGSGRLL
jgi:cytochrome d ubiquinol oxidase subunit I